MISRRTSLALAVLLARAGTAPAQGPAAPAPVTPNDNGQAALKRVGRFERTLTFVIDDDEMMPGTMSVPEGQYRLEFRNQFTSARLDIAIDDDRNARFANAEIKDKREVDDFIANLRPGRYTVFVRQRPRWRCVITVTEKARN